MTTPLPIFTDPRAVPREPNLAVFLFRPLSVPSGIEVIDLSSDEWTEIVPPAHVIAQIGGRK